MSQPEKGANMFPARRFFLLTLFASLGALLVWRAVDLQMTDGLFLQGQGDARHLRTVAVSAHRGVIRDRH